VFVSVNGPRETYYVDEPRILCFTSNDIHGSQIFLNYPSKYVSKCPIVSLCYSAHSEEQLYTDKCNQFVEIGKKIISDINF
jgi:hypothetical protein